MAKSQLNKLTIEKFRALNQVEVELGDHITVICGKNGTSKSSILGIAAQIFSFDRDYEKDEPLSFRQITGALFKSQYSEHFRISEKFDPPGSMKVNMHLIDGYSGKEATGKLELMKRGKSPRPVVRNNSTATRNTSRNFTHPVIFLSLKRLFPIADRDYNINEFDYLKDHKDEFIGLTNELLNHSSSHVTGTDGTISSAVSHGANYDQESVSAGEDNAGQIILAIMSFRKLKEEYPDYKGGMLLIDEADAGLFPTAQINLFKLLDRECKSLDLQVIMTSHSPVLIEHAFEQSKKFRRKFKTIYLSNTYGSVQVMQDWSWTRISADINTKTVGAIPGEALPKVNVYFEDREAADFFAVLMSRQPLKKYTKPLPSITLGCTNYLQLVKNGIMEFSEKSIICLDSDVAPKVAGKKFNTVVLLPGELPPDQLIFEFLYNLSADDDFWKNDLYFTRDVFTKTAAEVLRILNISGPAVNLKNKIAEYSGDKKLREVFKRFYNDEEFNQLFSSGIKPYNPWKYWVEKNAEASNKFLCDVKQVIYGIMKNGYSVDVSKLTSLDVKLKKV